MRFARTVAPAAATIPFRRGSLYVRDVRPEGKPLSFASDDFSDPRNVSFEYRGVLPSFFATVYIAFECIIDKVVSSNQSGILCIIPLVEDWITSESSTAVGLGCCVIRFLNIVANLCLKVLLLLLLSVVRLFYKIYLCVYNILLEIRLMIALRFSVRY